MHFLLLFSAPSPPSGRACELSSRVLGHPVALAQGPHVSPGLCHMPSGLGDTGRPAVVWCLGDAWGDTSHPCWKLCHEDRRRLIPAPAAPTWRWVEKPLSNASLSWVRLKRGIIINFLQLPSPSCWLAPVRAVLSHMGWGLSLVAGHGLTQWWHHPNPSLTAEPLEKGNVSQFTQTWMAYLIGIHGAGTAQSLPFLESLGYIISNVPEQPSLMAMGVVYPETSPSPHVST